MFSGAVSQDYKINKMYGIHLVHPANLVNHYETAFVVLALLLEFMRCLLPRVKK